MRPSRSPVRAAFAAVTLAAIAVTASFGAGLDGESGSAEDADGEARAAAALTDLLAREWAFRLREFPLFATSVGVHERNHLLPAMSREAVARRAEETHGFLAELDAIDPAALGRTARVDAAIFRRQLEQRIESFEHGDQRIPITVDSGFHIAFARLPDEVPLATVDDYDDYLARLTASPRYFGEHVEWMREGLATGMTMPRVVLDGYEVTIASHVVDAVEESVFWKPFESFPATFGPDDRERLGAAGRVAIAGAVVPAYRAFLEFMTGEYLPGCRTTIGASELPNGADHYRRKIRQFTTLDKSAEEIHRIGLEEVARIRAEMEAIIEEVGFDGGFAEFLAFLRTDPRFYAETPEELLREASYLAKKMDGKLPAFFKTLPRQPYGVAPVPDHLAPKYTGGRYVGAAPGSAQPGWYWVNTYALENRPLYVLPALTLHEAVPGHHLQIALTQELEALPPFRRHSYLSAFGEGWGLYSEWLGIEAGMYPDPYTRFGRLTYEMWRACRLVVDTGIHAFGWSRDRAMALLADNTALSLHEVKTETDRYISWPGQALAYKIGELEIRALRAQAEEALGERFDLRDFHDVVLRDGAVPLPVLRDNVERWIAEVAQPPA